MIEKLKEEVTNPRAERENVEKTLGAEARKWQNNYDSLSQLKQTVGEGDRSAEETATLCAY